MKKRFLIAVLAVVVIAAAAFIPLRDESSTTGSGDGQGANVVYVRQPESRTPGESPVAEAKLWPKQNVSLGFTSMGVVSSVLVKEGDRVHAGDVLAEIKGTESYRLQYAEAELNLAVAQDDLKEMNDAWPLDKADVARRLIEARQTLDDAKDDYADYDTPAFRKKLDDANRLYTDKWPAVEDAQDLVDKVSGLEPGSERRRTVEDDYKTVLQEYEGLEREYSKLVNERDLADAAVRSAEALVTDLERQLTELADGPKPSKLEVANQRIAAAEAQKTAAEMNIEMLQIIAPFDGVIVRLDLTEGELVQAGATVVVMADDSAQIVKTVDLAETDMVGVRTGNRVRVVFDAYPDQEIGGTVTKITNWAGAYLGDVVYPVEVTLDANDLPLLWGMTASVYF